MRELVASGAASLDASAAREDLYDQDFHAWTQRQAALIREGNLTAVDMANVLEEIETLGRKEVLESKSRYTVLSTHSLRKSSSPKEPAGAGGRRSSISESLLRDT